jgi:hypothetical protein
MPHRPGWGALKGALGGVMPAGHIMHDISVSAMGSSPGLFFTPVRYGSSCHWAIAMSTKTSILGELTKPLHLVANHARPGSNSTNPY